MAVIKADSLSASGNMVSIYVPVCDYIPEFSSPMKLSQYLRNTHSGLRISFAFVLANAVIKGLTWEQQRQL